MPVLYDDILLLILEHVHNQADRLRLLLVCRHWHWLLFSKAYERVSVSEKRIYRLVCSIHRNPEIGASIRDLSVLWCPGSGRGDYDVAMFRDSVQAASQLTEDCEKWERELSRGNPDAWLAVLVLSLEAVTSLSLSCGNRSPYFIPMLARATAAAAAREKPFDSKPVLQRLERVAAKTESHAISFPAADFLPFFCLPAMRVFSATALHEDCNWHSVPKPTPGTSGIKELRLGGCPGRCNGIEGMADYVASCANLEVFIYQHERTIDRQGRSLHFHPRGFYTALLTQRHSLRVLRLNIVREKNRPDGFNGFGFPSLFEFHQLRELQIPLRMLLEFGPDDQPTISLPEVLPQSLEHLCLAYSREGDTDVVVRNLHSMVEQRGARFPRLRELKVQPFALEQVPVARGSYIVTLEAPMWVKQAFAPLTMACDKLGIQFGFDNGRGLKIAS